MADLITPAEFRTWVGIEDEQDNAVIALVCAAGSGQVRSWCGRSFHVDAAQAASARYFVPLDGCTVMIDDAHTVTAVATDDADDGAWSTSWDATDYSLAPLGGVGPTGETGWPFTKIVAVETRYFPCVARPAVKVTAKWGWSALPNDVKVATMMVANELFRSKSGGSEFFSADGNFTPIRKNVAIRDLLQPYRGPRANDARFKIGG